MQISKNDKIYIDGHNGLVGSAILRNLKKKGFKKIITVSRKKLNLTDQKKTFNFLKKNKPKFIFIAAAQVGGINANNLVDPQKPVNPELKSIQFKSFFERLPLIMPNPLILDNNQRPFPVP